MSNIPYPNVPPLPGVPALQRAAPYVGAALTLLGEFLPLNIFGQDYAILATNTKSQLLVPDSFVDFEYKKEAKIPIYPMQGGAFQSYNKVVMPSDIKVTVTCSGNLTMSKQEFIQRITAMINSLVLVDISTPDEVYKNYNLIHVDYKRESTRGATMLIAQLWFQAVMIVTPATNNTAAPSGASATSLGSLTPINSPSSKLLSKVSSLTSKLPFN